MGITRWYITKMYGYRLMPTKNLNISENRNASKYSKRELLLRVLWSLVRPLFRYSPRPLFRWRCFLLRLFNARIGENVHIYNSATIYMPWNLEIGDWSSIGEYAFIYNLGKITIGTKTTISHRTHLCAGTHDYTDKTLPLLKLSINIQGSAWVCTDAFIGPGLDIGEGAVIGARSVVVKDVEPWVVVAGNPAIIIKKRVLKDD